MDSNTDGDIEPQPITSRIWVRRDLFDTYVDDFFLLFNGLAHTNNGNEIVNEDDINFQPHPILIDHYSDFYDIHASSNTSIESIAIASLTDHPQVTFTNQAHTPENNNLNLYHELIHAPPGSLTSHSDSQQILTETYQNILDNMVDVEANAHDNTPDNYSPLELKHSFHDDQDD